MYWVTQSWTQLMRLSNSRSPFVLATVDPENSYYLEIFLHFYFSSIKKSFWGLLWPYLYSLMEYLGWRLRGATPRPRPGEVAERSNPTSKNLWLHGHRRAERSYSTFKVRRGGREEIPLVQGREQRLCFAGAAVKRYPKSKVRETQVRQ